MLNYFQFWFIGSPIKRKKKYKKGKNSQISDDDDENDEDSSVKMKENSLTTVSEVLLL